MLATLTRLAAAILVATAVACASAGAQTTPVLSDHPAIEAFYRAFTTKDLSLLDKALADDWVDVPLAPGQGPGREGFKPAAESFFRAFPDIAAHVEDLVAEGNKVAVRSILSGTHRGPFVGAAPTGRRFEILAVDIHEIGPDGRIARTWHTEDWLTALHQLGLLPLHRDEATP